MQTSTPGPPSLFFLNSRITLYEIISRTNEYNPMTIFLAYSLPPSKNEKLDISFQTVSTENPLAK